CGKKLVTQEVSPK
nr:Chain A, ENTEROPEPTIDASE [Bos taurus]